jgi:hypothetical protein
MSADVIVEQELSWDSVRYAREAKRGVVLGLEMHQLISLATGMLFVVTAVFVFGFPLGWLVGGVILLVAVAISCTRYGGASLLTWTKRWLGRSWGKSTGQGKFLRAVRSETPVTVEAHLPRGDTHAAISVELPDTQEPAYRAKMGKKGEMVPGIPERFMLPGELNELLCYEMLSGEAFVYDPVNKYGIIAAEVESMNAFALESEDEKVNRTEAFSAMLTALASYDGVAFLQLTDQTSVVSGAKIRDYYRAKGAGAPKVLRGDELVPLAGPNINPFASQAYEDLVSNGRGIMHHEGWVVVVLSQTKLEKSIKAHGGGLPGFMDVAAGMIASVGDSLAATGTHVKTWMDAREMAACIRRSVDPASAVEISERVGLFSGVSPSAAGPMIMLPEWSTLTTDTGVHRSWWISEWPRKRAGLGFMNKLVFAGDFRHTVTLIARPYPAAKAMKDVTKSLADWNGGIDIQERMGRPVSRAQKLEGSDLEFQEAQLTDGFGALRIGGYVTVSAADPQELERNSTVLLNAASAAQVELRCLYGQQAEGFVASTMPLGRGLL